MQHTFIHHPARRMSPAVKFTLVSMGILATAGAGFFMLFSSPTGEQGARASYNGKTEYFNPAAFSNGPDKSFALTKVYPNPFSADFHVALDCAQPSEVSMQLIGAGGKVVKTEAVQCAPGSNSYTFSDDQHLAPGNYVLVMSDAQGNKTAMQMLTKR